jgi:hypothetical protein
MTLRIDGVDREITTGPLATARSIMHEVPVIDAIDERYEMAGGTLHVGSRVEAAAGRRVLARTVAGAWEGEMYSVYAFITGAGIDGRAIVDMFRACASGSVSTA